MHTLLWPPDPRNSIRSQLWIRQTYMDSRIRIRKNVCNNVKITVACLGFTQRASKKIVWRYGVPIPTYVHLIPVLCFQQCQMLSYIQ